MRIIGVADGVIMPTIITAHMMNMKRKSSADHGAKDDESIPIISPISIWTLSQKI
jgi:hypothetical protein